VVVAKSDKARTNKARTTQKRSAAGKTPTKEGSAAKSTASDPPVTLDRRSSRDRRKTPDRRKKNSPVAVDRRKIERRAKVNRRRQIDPTTCERDYSSDEVEFMNALDEYKRTSGRMFPTCSEILEVIKKLGYQKCAAGAPPAVGASETAGDSPSAGDQAHQGEEAAV